MSLRDHGLPTWLGRLGLVVGAAGIASAVPGLSGTTVLFGLLVIVWFAWLGITLLLERQATVVASGAVPLVRAAG